MEVTVNESKTVNAMVVEISAKCSDCCMTELMDADGNMICDHDGYVPKFFPGEHYGDYVMLKIDLATGKILNWTPPTTESLQEFVDKCNV